jgi:hypothetical protein
MADEELDPGVLPSDRVSKAETVVLVRSLLVDWKVLEHLRDHRVSAEQLSESLRAADCCKPDGGTCCVNKTP